MTGSSNLGTCRWGHTGHSPTKPCPEQATYLFSDSRLAYCTWHARMVQDNRDWLLDRLIDRPANLFPHKFEE